MKIEDVEKLLSETEQKQGKGAEPKRVQRVKRSTVSKFWIRIRGVRIGFIIFVVLLLTGATVVAVNVSKVADAKKLLEEVDDKYTYLESGIERVKQVGQFLTIHDEASFQSALNSIEIAPSLKNTLFSTDSTGAYHYTGTVSTEAPSYNVVEVQYSEPKEQGKEAEYFMTVNVMYSDGTRVYHVICSMQEGVLTSYHVY